MNYYLLEFKYLSKHIIIVVENGIINAERKLTIVKRAADPRGKKSNGRISIGLIVVIAAAAVIELSTKIAAALVIFSSIVDKKMEALQLVEFVNALKFE